MNWDGRPTVTGWPTRTFNVPDLFLDPANIRLASEDPLRTQADIIHDLFINQKAFSLLKNVARSGWFQHELPLVVMEGGKAIVLEGNRRVAALKAALNPSIVPSYSSRITAVRDSSPHLPLRQIEVKVVTSREAASELLATIHTTESRKPWATLRQAYFYYAQIESKARTLEKLIDDFPHVDIARFVRMWEMHRIAKSITYDSDEQSEQVADQYRFPISTFERVYDNEYFQKSFGIEFDEQGRARIKSEPESLKRSLKRIVDDILEKRLTSRTHNKAEDIAGYLKTIPKPTPKSPGRPLRAGSFKPYTPVPPAKRQTGLIPKDLTCQLPSPGVKRVLKELQELNYKRFPNAAHDLLRSFLECVLKAYFKEKGESIPRGRGTFVQLANVLTFAETYFDSNRELKQTIQVLRGLGGDPTRNYFKSQDFLNALNHNPSVFSSGQQVKDAWESMESLIRHCLA